MIHAATLLCIDAALNIFYCLRVNGIGDLANFDTDTLNELFDIIVMSKLLLFHHHDI